MWIEKIRDSFPLLCDIVHACYQRQEMVNLYKCSISVITETQFAIQSQVTQQPNCTERLHVDSTIIQSFRKSYFHISHRRRMPGTLAWQRPRLGDACQSGKMATLFNSLFFVFKISFLPNYRVKYYDYIVKWWSGVACKWCVSLDIGLGLALSATVSFLPAEISTTLMMNKSVTLWFS